MKSDARNEAAVVTGASRGIGREIAIALARNGHPLFLLGRDSAALSQLCRLCTELGSPRADFSVCDLTDSLAIQSLPLPESFPQPHILVNNAGEFLLKPLGETSPDEFEQQWRLHALAPFLLVQKWLPGMIERGRGLIVTIGSASATEGRARSGAYSSSKHAVLGFCRSLRREVTGRGVAVTSILPGQTLSDSWKGIDVDEDELIHPADIGELVVLLAGLHPQTVVEEIRLMPERGERSPD